MAECIFCKIAAGEIPAAMVYSDECVVAFMDIHPVTPGHLLVIPRRHVELATELDETTAGRLMAVANRLNAALRRSGIQCEGVNYYISDGEAAGQEVPHTHLHLIPRFAGDGFGLRFPERYYQEQPSREDLVAMAGEIKQGLEG